MGVCAYKIEDLFQYILYKPSCPKLLSSLIKSIKTEQVNWRFLVIPPPDASLPHAPSTRKPNARHTSKSKTLKSEVDGSRSTSAAAPWKNRLAQGRCWRAPPEEIVTSEVMEARGHLHGGSIRKSVRQLNKKVEKSEIFVKVCQGWPIYSWDLEVRWRHLKSCRKCACTIVRSFPKSWMRTLGKLLATTYQMQPLNLAVYLTSSFGRQTFWLKVMIYPSEILFFKFHF